MARTPTTILFIFSCVLFRTMCSVSDLSHDVRSSHGDSIKNNKVNIKPQRAVGSFINLYSMIECATKCDPVRLKYYGNFCGFGGGGIPINDIDRCCQEHDECYDQNYQNYGCYGSMYFLPYAWSCHDGDPSCDASWNDQCGLWTCVCDREFTDCLNNAGCP